MSKHNRIVGTREALEWELSGEPQFGSDWLPTFVTPTDAINYINETDAQWARLDNASKAANIDATFRHSWELDLAQWRVFRDLNLKDVGWLNTKAVMEQTDRWVEKAKGWDSAFQKAGVKGAGPVVPPPGQGTPPDSNPFTPYLIGGGVALGAIIALSILRKGSPV